MAKMTEHEFLSLIGQAERDAAIYNGEFMRQNEQYLSTYLGNLYGDEQPEQSQVVSTDVQDVVESDMPSLVRVFGNNKNIMQFEANTSNPADEQEAIEKTAYINWIINHQKNSYKVKVDWIKDALIQKMGVVRFDYVEKDLVDEQEYVGLDEIEMALLIRDLESESDHELELLSQDDDSIRFRVRRKTREFVIRNIPTENFLISRNATSKDDAVLVGDKTLVTRSQLIEMGFDAELVKDIPAYANQGGEGSTGDRYGTSRLGTMRQLRYQDEGGSHESEINHWSSQKVELSNLYVKIDYDGDGIAERRHVLKAGNVILENEPFQIVPYAIFSAITMPHDAIGRSRAELTQQTQRVKTVLMRQILDNIYRVNNGRVIVNDNVTNIDDLLTVRPNGIVRTDGDPMTAVAQLQTPYIGDRALQVVQYIDAVRAQSTGTYLSNQGLDSDQLYNETATRFLGVQEEGESKIELIARNMAETGFRELYDGLAWMVQHYHNDATEIMLLGKPVTIDPRKWRFSQSLICNVGLAAGDDENTIKNMAGLLQIDQQLKSMGSGLVDDKKTYNKIKRMLSAMGIIDVSEYYNDPEIPAELLQAQYEQLLSLAEQQQAQLAQLQNPLAEAEKIKAQKDLITAQAKLAIEQAKLEEQRRQFDAKLTEDKRQFNSDVAVELTKLEATHNKNVPGAII